MTSCRREVRAACLRPRVSTVMCWLLVSFTTYAVLGQTVTVTGPTTGGRGTKYVYKTPLLYFTVSAGTGCFGDGGTFPGLSFDGTSSSTFATNADFITPGNPRDAFLVTGTVSGVAFTHANNNGGGSSVTGGTFVDSSDATKVDLTWSASAAAYTISNRYTTDPTKPYIKVTTTITATSSITGLRFARSCDPDQDSPVGTTSTSNTCGWTDGTLTAPPSDIVIASGPIRPTLIIAMYTNDATPHGAGVSPGWSGNPVDYFNVCTAGSGDYAIGLSFNIGDMAAGQSKTIEYTYAFAAAAADFKILLQALTTSSNQCAAGKYLESGTTCTDCPAGSYNDTTNALMCGACAAGSYSNAGATSCTPCPANTYAHTVNSSSCTPCPAGTHSGTGATSCITYSESSTFSLSGSHSESATVSSSMSLTISRTRNATVSSTKSASKTRSTRSTSVSPSPSRVTLTLPHTRSRTFDLGAVVVTTVMVKFNGTQWALAMSLSRATIITSIRESVAAALGMPAGNIDILSVYVGSLIVVYRVTRNSTYAILDSGLHRIAQTEAAYTTLLSWYLATTGETATLSDYVVVEYSEVPHNGDVVVPLVVVGSVLCVAAILSVRWWVRRRSPSVVVVMVGEELSSKPPTHDPTV